MERNMERHEELLIAETLVKCGYFTQYDDAISVIDNYGYSIVKDISTTVSIVTVAMSRPPRPQVAVFEYIKESYTFTQICDNIK